MLLKRRHSSQSCVDLLDLLVDSCRHPGELGRLRADHFDQLRHIPVGYRAELVHGLHAAEDVLLRGLAREELEDGHRQLGADIVEYLKAKLKKYGFLTLWYLALKTKKYCAQCASQRKSKQNLLKTVKNISYL